ncbi:aryl sulfotransferase [Halarcobacter ebronensis]|uniref:Aryl sulfotransferase n=1 Tax=Halarcobacter ebronensis TaxID=1462615 RepID=A0A4V1LQP8_9BACT|nr:aryl-sulfate sulfotransferase [Halarcobacter ebronensis]RXJ65448.1 aryl sulfotransferase [Halarcobacter ebronensis]
MKISKIVSSLVLASMVVSVSPTFSMAKGDYGLYFDAEKSQGKLGAIITNPYEMAPQTAIIGLNGKAIADVSVSIEPKNGGAALSYKVPQQAIRTHDGIPVFGLYADYNNKINVTYKYQGKEIKETYKLYINPIVTFPGEYRTNNTTTYTPVKSSKEFKDRLYFVNNIYYDFHPDINWRRPGGAMPFSYPSTAEIIDQNGDIRWHLDTTKLFQKDSWNVDKLGFSMSYRQLKNGDILFMQGQRYMRYDIMGRKVYDRRLPRGFSDGAHEIVEASNGDIFIRVGKQNYLRPDGKIVHTLKDHIIEIDQTGQVVDVWDLNKILDNGRDVLLKALDQRAVCMSVDENAKHTEIDDSAPWGDVPGVGAGRNWAHTNSVYYNDSDDSIVVSLRHQGMAKITRDKKVKWILSSFNGWKGELAKKVLIPVDKNGKKLECGPNSCENTDFDWSFTQHTAYLNPELGKGYLTVFDNGEGRGNEQPAMVEDKYSRAVAYKIDENNMTVKQLWEYGKDRGFDWFSIVTGNVNYDKEKDSFHVASLNTYLMKFNKANGGFIDEIKLDKNGKPYLANEIKVNYSSAKEFGYRTGIVKPDLLFGK